MKNKADNKKRNFLTHSEIESLLKAANNGPHAARNYCLTLLCFIHGFRASEICRLRISDIDLKAKCIYIHRLKKGFSTTHPLLNKEVQALKNWLSIRTSYPHAESEWVFYRVRGIRFLGNSFTILSRLPVVMPGCHWRFIRTCYAIRVVLLWRIWE